MKQVGNRILGRCFFPVTASGDFYVENPVYEVYFPIKSNYGGDKKQTGFKMRLDFSDGVTLALSSINTVELPLPIYVEEVGHKKKWLDVQINEMKLLKPIKYYWKRSNRKGTCEHGVLKLPIFLFQHDLDQGCFMYIYPSIINKEETLVISVQGMKAKAE